MFTLWASAIANVMLDLAFLSALYLAVATDLFWNAATIAKVREQPQDYRFPTWFHRFHH